MAKLKDSYFIGELLHFNAARLRVTGSGLLLMGLFSLDDIQSAQFPSLNMSATTNREPTQLINFTEQRAYYKIEVNEIDEYFVISKLVIFIKPTAANYPQ